jgi:acetyl/propionyl-CoA carboxylase alpha subunit
LWLVVYRLKYDRFIVNLSKPTKPRDHIRYVAATQTDAYASIRINDKQYFSMRYIARIEDKNFEVDITERDGELEIYLDGKPVSADSIETKGKSHISFLFNHRSFDLEFSKNEEKVSVFLNGKKYDCVLEDEKTQRLKRLGGLKVETKKEKELKSPMPGLVTAIEVKQGDWVVAGEGVIIVEAMKMENELKAKSDGKVKAIKVKVHQAVEKDEVLIVFE